MLQVVYGVKRGKSILKLNSIDTKIEIIEEKTEYLIIIYVVSRCKLWYNTSVYILLLK